MNGAEVVPLLLALFAVLLARRALQKEFFR